MTSLGRIVSVCAIALALGSAAGAAERPTIVGMPLVKRHLANVKRAARPGALEAEHLGRIPRRSLILGGSGSGKTLLLTDLREDLAEQVTLVDGGTTNAKKLAKVLRTAAEPGGPRVIGIDNVDRMDEATQRQLASSLEGVERFPDDVSIVATATSDKDVKPELRAVFQKKLTIPALARADREALLRVVTKRTPLASALKIEEIAKLAKGRSGRDLRDIVMLAREHALDDASPEDIAALEAIEPGDPIPADLRARVVVTREHLERAIEERPPVALNGAKVTTPKLRFDDIGGLDDEKEWLRRFVIAPARHPEKYTKAKRLLRGVLLAGEPGNGKTMIAEAMATEMGAQLVHLDPTSVYEKWLGESGRNLERVIESAVASAEPGGHIVLFMDEADGVGRTRAGGGRDDGASAEEGRVMAQMLQMINGANSKFKNVTLVMATNRPDAIDPALKRAGRSDGLLVIGKPEGPKALKAVLAARLKGTPVAANVNWDILARQVEGSSGADLDQLATLAELLADEEGTEHVEQRHFDAAQKVQRKEGAK